MYQVFSTNAFPVGVNGVKPDFKGVSARLDTREETRSEPQWVSHPAQFVCECSPTGSWLASRYTGVNRYGDPPPPRVSVSSFLVSASCSLWGRSLAERESLSFLPSSSLSSFYPSLLSFSGRHEVSSLPPLTTTSTLLKTMTAVKCGGRSGETRKRTRRTWTWPLPPSVMMKTTARMTSARRALAAFGSWVRRRRGSAGTAPGRGSLSGGVACKPVPPAAPACRCESRSDGRSTKRPNSRRSADRDRRPDLDTQNQTLFIRRQLFWPNALWFNTLGSLYLTHTIRCNYITNH